ncbi:MAG TPA: AAA family ATPase [Pyrinomonadaceae bacterium]
MSRNEEEWDEDVAREAYPWLYGVEERSYEPPGLEPKYQKILDEEKAKLAERARVVDEHGEDYHNIDEVTDEMLPTLNFRRYDNLFLARPANAYIESVARAGPSTRTARRLLGNFWLEGELSVLFSETGLGKSALAMQIGRALTGGKSFDPFETDIDPIRCLYFDFELSGEHFGLRYTAERPDPLDTGKLFPDTLIRLPPQFFQHLPPGYDNFYDFLISSLLYHVHITRAKALIIDNITWLNPNIESSPSMQRLMQTLVHIKKHHGVSILLIAHTPKRHSRGPITISHLQGAATLGNFVDSCFALGRSRRGHDIRYLKAVKHRNTAGSERDAAVATLRIGKTGRFLGFDFEGYAMESEHCGWGYGEGGSEAFIQSVLELLAEKRSQRQIADTLNVSLTTVNRCVQSINKN